LRRENKESTKKKSNFRYVFLLFLNFMCSWHNIIKNPQIASKCISMNTPKSSCIYTGPPLHYYCSTINFQCLRSFPCKLPPKSRSTTTLIPPPKPMASTCTTSTHLQNATLQWTQKNFLTRIPNLHNIKL